MMSEAVRGLWTRPWAVLIGALLGLVLTPTVFYSAGMLADLYYEIAPISKLSGELLRADSREIYVHLRTEKRNVPSCKFVMLRARTLDNDNEYELANATRVDMPAIGETLPPGKHDIGLWRIEPRSDGVVVSIAQMYDCAGQIVWGAAVVFKLPPLTAGEGPKA